MVGLFVYLILAPGGSGAGSFSGQLETLGTVCVEPCAAANVTVVLPAGANVTVRWIDLNGGYVVFQIVGLTGYHRVFLVCQEIGTYGTCRFDSYGGNYTVRTWDYVAQRPQTVEFWGSYSPGLPPPEGGSLPP